MYRAKSFGDQCKSNEALVTEQDEKATFRYARPECGLIIAVVDAAKIVPTPTTDTIN